MPPALVTTWHLGKALRTDTPHHIQFFTGSAVRIFKGNNLRWWSITLRLYQGNSITSVSIRPQEKINSSQVCDLIIESLHEDFSDDGISTATDLDAIIVISSSKPKSASQDHRRIEASGE